MDTDLNSLCTGGGEISIVLMEELRSFSRRQRMNVFKATLEAEYAGMPAPGTMVRLEVVLLLLASGLDLV